MKLKGIFKQSSIVTQFLVLFSVTIIGLTITSIIGSIILMIKFGSETPTIIQEIMQNIVEYPEWMKNIQFLQTIGIFIFPAIICAWLFSDNYKNYLHIDTSFQLHIVGLVILSMLVIIPFLNSIYVLNQQIVFPERLNGLEEWIKNQEKIAKKAIDQMLYIYHWQDLVSNIMIVCVFTAIGEEFIFRGILQNLLSRFIKNPYIVIWIVAILFSANHLQFYGFFPRILLGAYLGYLLHYTNSIWISVFAHFTNNFFGVINSYIFQCNSEIAEKIDNIGIGNTWWLSVISLVFFIILLRIIKNYTYPNHPKIF